MTMMLVCGQILIGTFHECTEKFKLAAFVGYLHIVLSCPIIVGTFGAYQDFVYPFPGRNPPVSYSMWDSEQCQVSWLQTKMCDVTGTRLIVSHWVWWW